MVLSYIPSVLLFPIYMVCLISVMFVTKNTSELLFRGFSLQNNLIRSTYDPEAMIYTVEGADNSRKVSDHFGKTEYIDLRGRTFIPKGDFNITAKKGCNFVFLYEDSASMMPTRVIFLKQAPDKKMNFAELIGFIENNKEENDVDDIQSLNTMLYLSLYGYMDHFSISVLNNAVMGYINHDIYFVIRVNSPLTKLGKDEDGKVSYPILARLIRATILVKNEDKTYMIQLRNKNLNIKTFLFFYTRKRNEQAKKIYEQIIKNELSFGLPEVQVDCISKWKDIDYDQELISRRSKIRFIG